MKKTSLCCFWITEKRQVSELKGDAALAGTYKLRAIVIEMCFFTIFRLFCCCKSTLFYFDFGLTQRDNLSCVRALCFFAGLALMYIFAICLCALLYCLGWPTESRFTCLRRTDILYASTTCINRNFPEQKKSKCNVRTTQVSYTWRGKHP